MALVWRKIAEPVRTTIAARLLSRIAAGHPLSMRLFMNQTVITPDFIALADARVKNLASVSYRRLIVFRLKMADPEDAVGMGYKVSAVQSHEDW